MKKTPTIKGVFVVSHVQEVERVKGKEGLTTLKRCFGMPVSFKKTANVLVSDEVKLLECAAQILSKKKIPKEKLAFESGVLHFRDFAKTPLGKILFKTFHHPNMLLRSTYIAEHVFNGITFTVLQLGANEIKIVMEGGVYPLEHFQGLFWAWVDYLGYETKVKATQLAGEKYEYVISWNKKKTV